jgi:hypothetical protein
MQVSLQSKLCLGATVAFQAYFAYSNPKRWITCFVIGGLAGTLIGRLNLHQVQFGHQPKQGMEFDEVKDKKIKKYAFTGLNMCVPDSATLFINLMALGFLSQKIHLTLSSGLNLGTYYWDFTIVDFGVSLGCIFHLAALRNIQDPYVQKLLLKL